MILTLHFLAQLQIYKPTDIQIILIKKLNCHLLRRWVGRQRAEHYQNNKVTFSLNQFDFTQKIIQLIDSIKLWSLVSFSIKR